MKKTILIALVLLALATTAHAQAGTGMLAPWNANAHPINAGGGAMATMPRSHTSSSSPSWSTPHTPSPSWEAPHTSTSPAWMPTPTHTSPSSYASPGPQPGSRYQERFDANGFSSGTPTPPVQLPGWNPYQAPPSSVYMPPSPPPNAYVPPSHPQASPSYYMPSYGAAPGYSSTDYYNQARARINAIGH